MKWVRTCLHLLVSFVFLCLLSACFQAESENERTTISVLDFPQLIYNLFAYEHSDIDIDLQPLDPLEAFNASYYETILDGPNPPDLVGVTHPIFYELMEQQRLLPLDPYMAQLDLDEADFVPGILDILRSDVDDQLYGMSTGFSSHVLIYNKTMFDRANLPYPSDHYTWDELFQWARQLTVDQPHERIYGFNFRWTHSTLPLLEDWLKLYVPPLGFKLHEDGKMTVQSEGWQQLWELYRSLANDGVFPGSGQHPISEDVQDHHLSLFELGKLAMSIVRYADLPDLIEFDQFAHLVPDYEGIDWGIAPLPRNAENPHVIAGLQPGHIFAINAQASHAAEAWEFIEYVLSEDNVYSGGSIPALLEQADRHVLSGLEQEELSHFYAAPFVWHPDYDSLVVTDQRNWLILNEGDREFRRVLSGEKTIEQALRDWEQAGNGHLR